MRESYQRQAGAEIEVTPAMIEAGMSELRQHMLGENLECVIEEVFRAMAYESPELLQLASQDN